MHVIDVIIFIMTAFYVITSAIYILWLSHKTQKCIDEAYTEGMLDGLEVKKEVDKLLNQLGEKGGDE